LLPHGRAAQRHSLLLDQQGVPLVDQQTEPSTAATERKHLGLMCPIETQSTTAVLRMVAWAAVATSINDVRRLERLARKAGEYQQRRQDCAVATSDTLAAAYRAALDLQLWGGTACQPVRWFSTF
jgi:cobyrinic acid a,c-diamide synthase